MFYVSSLFELCSLAQFAPTVTVVVIGEVTNAQSGFVKRNSIYSRRTCALGYELVVSGDQRLERTRIERERERRELSFLSDSVMLWCKNGWCDTNTEGLKHSVKCLELV